MARSGHLGQFTAWSCQIWQLEVHILSQRLRCFPTESRAAIFSQRRQDCPLPLPINRVGIDGLREEKIGSKVSQKTSLSPFSCCRFSSFLPLPAAAAPANSTAVSTTSFRSSSSSQPSPPRQVVRSPSSSFSPSLLSEQWTVHA